MRAPLLLCLVWQLGCSDPFTFELLVGELSGPPDVSVSFDGIPSREEAPLRREFDSYDDAAGAAPVLVEVWLDGVVTGSRSVEVDACHRRCLDVSGEDCGLDDLVASNLRLHVRSDGRLSELEGSCTDGEVTFEFAP